MKEESWSAIFIQPSSVDDFQTINIFIEFSNLNSSKKAPKQCFKLHSLVSRAGSRLASLSLALFFCANCSGCSLNTSDVADILSQNTSFSLLRIPLSSSFMAEWKFCFSQNPIKCKEHMRLLSFHQKRVIRYNEKKNRFHSVRWFITSLHFHIFSTSLSLTSTRCRLSMMAADVLRTENRNCFFFFAFTFVCKCANQFIYGFSFSFSLLRVCLLNVSIARRFSNSY